jgi:hypothetical protein
MVGTGKINLENRLLSDHGDTVWWCLYQLVSVYCPDKKEAAEYLKHKMEKNSAPYVLYSVVADRLDLKVAQEDDTHPLV